MTRARLTLTQTCYLRVRHVMCQELSPLILLTQKGTQSHIQKRVGHSHLISELVLPFPRILYANKFSTHLSTKWY